jgi:hypothetical protein
MYVNNCVLACQALQGNVATLTPKFSSLNKTGKLLLHDADDSVVPPMRARLFKVNAHWNETTKKAREQNVILKEAFSKTKEVVN